MNEAVSQTEYYDNHHEKEAWIEAINVFKKVYPDASGTIHVGHHTYEIPEESNY